MNRKTIVISGAILLLFIIAYYIKDKMGINLLPHRHLLIFPEGSREGSIVFIENQRNGEGVYLLSQDLLPVTQERWRDNVDSKLC